MLQQKTKEMITVSQVSEVDTLDLGFMYNRSHAFDFLMLQAL